MGSMESPERCQNSSSLVTTAVTCRAGWSSELPIHAVHRSRQPSTSSASPTDIQFLALACFPWTYLKDCIRLATPEEQIPCSESQFTLTELTKIHCARAVQGLTQKLPVYQKIFLIPENFSKSKNAKEQIKLLMSAKTPV